MPKIISSSYQKEDGIKGYILKQLYCPRCNEEIFGQGIEEPKEATWVGRIHSQVFFLPKLYYYYQCFNCGWQVTGSDAELLHLQFIEDLI